LFRTLSSARELGDIFVPLTIWWVVGTILPFLNEELEGSVLC
jgi:hypothetical protein